MSDNKQLSPNKQALLKIRELKQQLAANQNYEPIAVVSMACRFPNTADTPEKFWESLVRQDDLVGDIPGDRWDLDAFHDDDPDVPGKMYAKRGVFLDSIADMDPEFFGISPREATWVDPQQRLLMEVGWEAIERAGWVPEEIGQRTGVFVGWMHNDYQNEASDSFLNLNPYIATGAAGSFLCGRLAYYLGLQGPSVAVDTACSSSLVALHLAIQSLQLRDCDRALVGGVNAICSPTTNILTCKLKALSPSGHSRAFDAAADGYLRGEGCGIVTLRRLSDAESDGDNILGIIRGSAVGHNGSGSGLTVPNPKAQEKVIREALEQSGFGANDVDYLEAHGTGTSLGDPIEVNAATAALCEERDANKPLLIGSVKTNIGHLEAAAGMAGLIKVLLAMENGSIPGQMNFETPNPHIAWDKIPVKVLTGETDWPNPERRVAGVSAFGMSGTNAHIVIEAPNSAAAPRVSVKKENQNRPAVITLSGKTEAAVYDLAAAFENSLSQNDSIDIHDFARQSNISRSHFEHRAAIVASNITEAKQKLQTLTTGGAADNVFVGNARRQPRVAWQFTGQGSQFVGMGRQLYHNEPVYRDAVNQCDEHLKSIRDGSLLQVLFDDESEQPLINHTHWTQPAIFALQMGLVKLLQSWNLQPNIVLGHSVGQYAAACVAGIMSWEDGLRLIAERGRLIGELPEGGLMLAVFAPAEAVQNAISNEPAVSLAALNGTHTVISGEQDAVQRVEKAFSDRSVRTKQLTTSHAFHSALMEPVLEPFAKIASTVQFSPAQMPLVCNATGQILAADKKLDGQYWAQHIRKAVAFAPSIETLAEADCGVLVELGPQSVLTRMAAANWQRNSDALISCSEKDRSSTDALMQAIAKMYVRGITPDFCKLHKDRPPTNNRITLPTYPFQRRRFWGPDKPRASHAEFHTAHPLLGSSISLAGSDAESRFESYIDTDSPSWMADHEVMNSIVLPGAALLEIAIEAAGNQAVENVAFEQPIRPTGRTALQTVLTKGDDSEPSELKVFAREANSQNWVRHFSGQLRADDDSSTPEKFDLDEIKSRLPETDTPETFYRKLNDMGLNYGPAFRCIAQLHFSETEVLTHLQVQGDVRGYNIPPTLLDAALHSLAVGLLKSADDHLFLPVGMGRIKSFAAIESEAWCYATWKQNEGKIRTADVTLISTAGEVLLKIDDLKVQQVSLAAMRQMSGIGAERLVYDLQWKPTRLSATKLESKKWLVAYSNESNFAGQLQEKLVEQGHQITKVNLAEPFTEKESWTEYFSSISENTSEPPFDGVVWLVDQPTSSEKTFDSNTRSIVAFTQAMIDQQWRRLPCGIQFVTHDAIAIDETENVQPNQTQIWGLGRVIGAEQPELRCRMLDLRSDQLDNERTLAVAVDVTISNTTDSQHVIRDGQLFAPRMKQTRLDRKKSDARNFAASENGSYLITGGLGKLGRHVAKWLAGRGAGQLVLVSRRKPNGEVLAFVQSIESLGAQVVVHSCDMSSASDVESLFARFGDDLLPLKGVVHAAGVLDDGLIESQTTERFEKVLKPKIVAARLLDEMTQALELDLFVLYSSVASILGSPGQSNYATGNAFLDGLAARRRASGLPTLSINWGPWTEGMADDPRILKRLSLQGITPLSVDDAHSALEKLITGDTVQATVMDVDWRRMRIGPTGEVPPMLQELVGGGKKSRGGDSALVKKLRSLQGKAQRELIVKTMQDSLQGILSTPEPPETDRPLIEMGLDSLMAVEFGTELQQMLGDGFNVGPTMLFDHPTIDAISDFVLELVTTESASEKTPTATAKTGTARQNQQVAREDIAIIGMSCRFPGAENVDQFWQNLLNGVDSVCDIPSDRWDVDRFYSPEREPGKMYTRQGGFLEGIADFDAAFFNISDQEACWIDPQHRMLLQNSYRALEDAGIPTAPIADSNVGVFMGIMGSDYAFLPTLDDDHIVKGFQGAGLSHSAGVGRISFIFGFEGPSVAVDTASSSSLVAVYQAVRSLQEGNCNLALAGGANAILVPVNSLLMSKAGLLSPDGRCKSFSKSADGFGRGEGCGVVVLKRLSDAQTDGDRIMAVIRGGAVVHNGFSSGITSPSGKAQSRVIDAAVKDAGITPAMVQYLEAHGTGTEFGDPMELGAAASVYGKGRKKETPLLVGSVKANISHLEAAGGASGLIKTVLALHHGMIPQQIHHSQPSPHVPWNRMPVKMVTENTPWPDCQRKTAGVTAIGLVGTNAHLVLSEPEPHPPNKTGSDDTNDSSAPRGTGQIVLSARSEQALNQLGDSYASYLQQNPEVDLNAFCFTLAAGRRHYEKRRAFTFDSREDAIGKLRNLSPAKAPHFATKENGQASKKKNPSRSNSSPRVAWIFGEHRSIQTPDLLELLEFNSEVAEFFEQCDQRLTAHTSGAFSLRESVSQTESQDSQLTTYTMQTCLSKLWQQWGIQPDGAFGFGVGQYSAACVAGCLCFLDALVLVYEGQKLLSDQHTEDGLVGFENLADQFNFYPPNLPLVCSLTGEIIPVHRSLGGSYWREHLDADNSKVDLKSLAELECQTALVLGSTDEKFTNRLQQEAKCSQIVQSFGESAGKQNITLIDALGKLYKSGCNPDFKAVYNSKRCTPLSLPPYPFQKKRYWITEISEFMETENSLEVESSYS